MIEVPIRFWTGAIIMTWKRLQLALAAGAVSALITNNACADGYGPSFNYSEPCCWKWSGFYIGGHVGSAWSLVDWSNVSLTGERVNNDGNTFIGGGQIGYNWQISHFILGLEGSLSGTNPVGNAISIVDPAISYRTTVHALGTVTGRVGFAAQRVLIYAKGGWAIGRDEVSGHIQTTNDSFSIANTKNGWTVGTGFEFMFWNGWSAGLDYSYVDLGSERLSGATALALPVTIRDIDTRIHFLTARINFY